MGARYSAYAQTSYVARSIPHAIDARSHITRALHVAQSSSTAGYRLMAGSSLTWQAGAQYIWPQLVTNYHADKAIGSQPVVIYFISFLRVRAPNSGFLINDFLHAHARAYTCALSPPLLLSLLLMTVLLPGSLKLCGAENKTHKYFCCNFSVSSRFRFQFRFFVVSRSHFYFGDAAIIQFNLLDTQRQYTMWCACSRIGYIFLSDGFEMLCRKDELDS